METLVRTSLITVTIASIVACGGGSEGGSTTSPQVDSTRQITAIDGLLYNAAIFNDKNNNLTWDKGEPLLGLTDQQGTALVQAKDTDRIGVVTLVPGSTTSLNMALQDAKYSGVTTVDMDFPNQPMAKELTLVAPKGIDIISPYTHLLSGIIQREDSDIESAESTLKEQLEAQGLTFDVMANYINELHSEQHKLAQLIADAMARTPETVVKDWRNFIEEGALIVKQMEQSQLSNPNTRPTIDGDLSTPVIGNSQLVYNKNAWDSLYTQWQQIGDISTGDSGVFFTVDLNAITIDGESAPLYVDPDQIGQTVVYSLMDGWAQGLKQELSFTNRLKVRIEEDGSTLIVYSDEVFKAEFNDFFLIATDVDAQGNKVGSTFSPFSIRTSSSNSAPKVSENARSEIQQQIDSYWTLEKGQEFQQEIDVSQWFSDAENDPLTYSVSGSLIDLGLKAHTENGRLVISGIPVRSFSEDGIQHNLVITASDGHNFTTAQVDVLLPKVRNGLLLESNPLVGERWYYIEETEDDGIVKNYCSYIEFANGKVIQTLADVYDYHGCNQAESQTIGWTSYEEVNLTTLNESVMFRTKQYTVRYSQETPNGTAYAVTIDHYLGQDNHDVRMFYRDKSEVERRLNIDSNNQALAYSVPTGDNMVQTNINTEVGDNYVQLAFDDKVTCEQLEPIFDLKRITGLDSYQFGGTTRCINEQDGVSTNPKYVLSFNNDSRFVTGQPYFIHLEYRDKKNGQYGESIRFNFMKD